MSRAPFALLKAACLAIQVFALFFAMAAAAASINGPLVCNYTVEHHSTSMDTAVEKAATAADCGGHSDTACGDIGCPGPSNVVVIVQPTLVGLTRQLIAAPIPPLAPVMTTTRPAMRPLQRVGPLLHPPNA